MTSSQQQVLFALVQAALDAGVDDIQPGFADENVVLLRALGFVEISDDRLSDAAFLAYFETFERLAPPKLVEDWARALVVPPVYWRKPIGRIRDQMAPQHRGKSFPRWATAFIGKHANFTTWLHELGHIVYARITADEMAAFASSVRENIPIITSDGTQPVIDPGTKQTVLLPAGKYLQIEGRMNGVDHSGADNNAMDDECWATIFGLALTRTPLPEPVCEIFEQIISRLRTTTQHNDNHGPTFCS